jgi:hypothetical protein
MQAGMTAAEALRATAEAGWVHVAAAEVEKPALPVPRSRAAQGDADGTAGGTTVEAVLLWLRARVAHRVPGGAFVWAMLALPVLGRTAVAVARLAGRRRL